MRPLNTILTRDLREEYSVQLKELVDLCPEVAQGKIAFSDIQQAFVVAQVAKFATKDSKILCVGYNCDTAYYTLLKKGYSIDAIDPLFNMDLNTFYTSWKTNPITYDVIFSTSVIEHVKDDILFINQIAEMLSPNGHGILTMDFNNQYVVGDRLPSTDERFYTTDYIMNKLIPTRGDCSLVDIPDYDKYQPDFQWEGVDYGFASLVFKKNA